MSELAGRRPVATSSSSTTTVSSPIVSAIASPPRDATRVQALVEAHVDAVGAQPGGDPLAREGLRRGEQPRTVVDQHDLRPEPLERLRQLAADHAAAEHPEPPRGRLRRGGLARSPDRTPSRPGTGGRTGTLPVASTTAWRAVRVVGRPPSIATVFSPVSRPRPRITVMPAPSAHFT